MAAEIAAIAGLAAHPATRPLPAVRDPRSYTRSQYACELCHKRKVRCDIARSGRPCTNCTIDNRECTPREKRKRRTNRRRTDGVPLTGVVQDTVPSTAESVQDPRGSGPEQHMATSLPSIASNLLHAGQHASSSAVMNSRESPLPIEAIALLKDRRL